MSIIGRTRASLSVENHPVIGAWIVLGCKCGTKNRGLKTRLLPSGFGPSFLRKVWPHDLVLVRGSLKTRLHFSLVALAIGEAGSL